jgi:hypothetical protein
MKFTANPELLPHAEAAKFVEVCPRFLTACCRSGALAWPADPWGRFRKDDLRALRVRFGKPADPR